MELISPYEYDNGEKLKWRDVFGYMLLDTIWFSLKWSLMISLTYLFFIIFQKNFLEGIGEVCKIIK